MAILANGQKIDYIPAPDNYIIHKSRTVALNRSISVRQQTKAIRMDGFYFLVNDGVRKTNRKTDTISILCNELQQLFVPNQSEKMLQNKGFNPVLPNSPLVAELFLFGAKDVVVMLYFLLAGSADTGHSGTAFSTEYLAKQDIIHFGLFVGTSFLIKGQQVLNFIEHIHIYDGRHRIFYTDFTIVFVGANPCLSTCTRRLTGLERIFPQTEELPSRCWKRPTSRRCGFVAIYLG